MAAAAGPPRPARWTSTWATKESRRPRAGVGADAPQPPSRRRSSPAHSGPMTNRPGAPGVFLRGSPGRGSGTEGGLGGTLQVDRQVLARLDHRLPALGGARDRGADRPADERRSLGVLA